MHAQHICPFVRQCAAECAVRASKVSWHPYALAGARLLLLALRGRRRQLRGVWQHPGAIVQRLAQHDVLWLKVGVDDLELPAARCSTVCGQGGLRHRTTSQAGSTRAARWAA